MIKSFFWSSRWMLHAYGGSLALFGCMYGQIHLAVMLNEWSKRFFDIFGNPLEHTMDDIYNRIVELTLIIVLRVGVDVAATSFTRLYTFQWREALTFYYLPLWCNTDIHVEGASQRIQEDISRAAKVVESMGWTVVSTLMTLVAFIPILWSLSHRVSVPYFDNLPGSLVWVSILASSAGFVISWIIGGKLPEIDVDSQKIEATFRKVLVHGESPKIRARTEFFTAIVRIFAQLWRNTIRAILHNSYFDIWKYSYMKAMYVVPLLLVGPAALVGAITIGDMMQAVHAFGEVTNGLSVFINNWHMVTEIRSIRWRLVEFEKKIIENPRTEDSETDEDTEIDKEIDIPPEAGGN